jgi:hypothetical protein
MKSIASAAVLLSLTVFAPAAAMAQATRLGETFLVSNGAVRGSAVAYDPKNDVYLVVSGNGVIAGRFVRADGAPLGAPFQVQETVFYGQFPMVAYSPDANSGNGGFLVTWHESDGPLAPSVHTRMVSYASGFLGPDRKITGNDSYWELMGSPVAYSTASREFLVIWRAYFATDIYGMRVGNDGAPLAGAFAVATTPTFESSPTLTYNSAQDEFYAVYSFGFTTVRGQRIKPVSGALLGGPVTIATASAINTTGVTYNAVTGQYLAAWHQFPGDVILSRVLDWEGTPTGNVNALSGRFGTYDSLSLAASPVTGTTFMVGHDKLSVEDGGVEVRADGIPTNTGFLVTAAGGGGNFHPRASAHATRSEWLVSTANSFSRTVAQRVGTNSGPPVGPPPPAAPQPMMSIDLPGGPVVQQPFVMAGWGLDRGAGTGNGADVIHVYAWPNGGGAPLFVGQTSISLSRPDLANVFGGQFGSSGWALTINNLPPGSYQLAAYLRSTVTNSFSLAKTVPITIFDTLMTIDTPQWERAVPHTFLIGGWAIDRGAPAGTGVDALHVWAYPHTGAAPLWVGVANYGAFRPDVAAAFGSSRYANSGYNIIVNTLPTGWYDIVVFSHSTATNSFTTSRVVRTYVSPE